MELLFDFELLPISLWNWEHWNTKDGVLTLPLSVRSLSSTSFEQEMGKFKIGEPSHNTRTVHGFMYAVFAFVLSFFCSSFKLVDLCAY